MPHHASKQPAKRPAWQSAARRPWPVAKTSKLRATERKLLARVLARLAK
jgi:hypothetical protein